MAGVVMSPGLLSATLLLCAVAPPRPAASQDPKPAPSPVFASTTDVVNVTVSVRDDDGNFVADLTRDDFEVYENDKRQALQLFSRAEAPGEDEALGLNLGLLLDTSESMLQQLKLSQEAAVRFLENIPRARDLLMIFFDQDIRISRYDSENQQGLFARIHEAKGSGNTALYDAIAVYLSRVQDTAGRKVLVLLTDGEDSTSTIGLGELIDMVRSSPVTIYPVAFTAGFHAGSARGARARAFLLGLAQQSGGQMFSPTASRELADVYQRILNELSSQYVLGYTSSDTRRDGKYRKLRVELKRKDLKVRHRSGYRAPGEPR
jgi:Ca-activated chloride channel family protein